MNTKRVIFFVIFFLFIVPITNTYADTDTFSGVSLYSDNRVYATPFTTENTYSMMAAAQVQFTGDTHNVYLQLILDRYTIQYQTSLDYFSTWATLPNRQYGKLLPTSNYPPPGLYYEQQGNLLGAIARFYIDLNGNGKFDDSGMSSEPVAMIPPRPLDTYIQLSAVTNVNITGGIHPTVTWDPVSGADQYKVLILGLDADGNPAADDLKFMTSDFNNVSFVYNDNLFASGQSYAIAIEARDYLEGWGFVNRSRYYFKYSAVPEPTSMLLLGLGLIGLAGIRRKFKK